MRRTNRLPRAPSTPLPELAEFLQPFHVQFRRRCSLATIHQQVCETLLFRAIDELIRTNCIEEYRPRWN